MYFCTMNENFERSKNAQKYAYNVVLYRTTSTLIDNIYANVIDKSHIMEF